MFWWVGGVVRDGGGVLRWCTRLSPKFPFMPKICGVVLDLYICRTHIVNTTISQHQEQVLGFLLYLHYGRRRHKNHLVRYELVTTPTAL